MGKAEERDRLAEFGFLPASIKIRLMEIVVSVSRLFYCVVNSLILSVNSCTAGEKT